MKAIILAAGKGTRMGELTKTTPKPLLTIRDLSLLEFKIKILPPQITEVIIVIGYLGELIKEKIGAECYGKKITYVEAEPLGTAFALFAAKEHLTERFMVLMGDDLYSHHDIVQCMEQQFCALVAKKDGQLSGGKMILTNDGFVADILEGKHEGGGLISTGLFILSPIIFNYPMQKMPGREEFGIPPTIMQAIHEMPLAAIYATAWKQVSSKEDLILTNEEYDLFTRA